MRGRGRMDCFVMCPLKLLFSFTELLTVIELSPFRLITLFFFMAESTINAEQPNAMIIGKRNRLERVYPHARSPGRDRELSLIAC